MTAQQLVDSMNRLWLAAKSIELYFMNDEPSVMGKVREDIILVRNRLDAAMREHISELTDENKNSEQPQACEEPASSTPTVVAEDEQKAGDNAGLS